MADANRDARVVELLTCAVRRRDQGRIARLEKKSPPVIEGDCTTDDETGARLVDPAGGKIGYTARAVLAESAEQGSAQEPKRISLVPARQAQLDRTLYCDSA
jgi:hypothetical protein